MTFQCSIFNIMKFLNIIFFYCVAFLVTEVSCSDNDTLPTTFIGLEDDNSMGHTGYVYLSTDATTPPFELSGCKSQNLNESMCRFPPSSQLDEGTVSLLRAWTAVTLRENILSILGYFLHQTKIKFNENIEFSLNLIYEQVRLNNIQMLEFLPRFRPIVKLNKDRRSVTFFRALKSSMPPYCRSSIEELVREFFKLTNKLMHNTTIGNPLKDVGVLLMANVSPGIIQFLRPKPARRYYDRNIGTQFGIEYAIFFTAIQKGKVKFTQATLGLLMLLTRFKELSAQEMEDFKFLTDVLLFEKIPNWCPTNSVNLRNISGPYLLIKRMMEIIVNRVGVDPITKSIAANMHDRLTPGYISDHKKPMLHLFDKPNLNISLILEMLENAAPIPEVKLLYDMIDNGTINLKYVLKGFNRYYYNTPDKLLLGFVRRIQNRVPMDDEIRDHIQSIIFHLLGAGSKERKENYDDMDIRNRRGMESLNLYEAYPLASDDYDDDDDDDDDDDFDEDYSQQTSISQSCHLSDCLTTVLTSVTPSQGNENSTVDCPVEAPVPELSIWMASLDGPIDNIQLSSLFVDASTLLTNFMSNVTIIDFMNNLYNNQSDEIYNDNNFTSAQVILPNMTVLITATGNEPLQRNDMMESNETTPEYNETKKILLINILKEMLTMTKVRTRHIVYYEVMRLYCILIYGLDNYKPMIVSQHLQLDELRSDDIIIKLSTIVTDQFNKLITDYDPLKEVSTESDEGITNRVFLIEYCKKLLSFQMVKDNIDLFNEIIGLLHSVQGFPIKLSQIITYAPSVAAKDIPNFKIVRDFLEKQQAVEALGNDFDIGRYPIKGRLLRAIMEKISNHESVRENATLLKSIQLYIPKIKCNGIGGESTKNILLAVELGQINIHQIIENAIDRTKIDPIIQNTVSNIWQWYANSPDSAISTRMNTNLFESRAEFIEGFLNTMESNIERDYIGMKKDIDVMRSAIVRTGHGAAPIDYI